jgi:hypothetical protein
MITKIDMLVNTFDVSLLVIIYKKTGPFSEPVFITLKSIQLFD